MTKPAGGVACTIRSGQLVEPALAVLRLHRAWAWLPAVTELNAAGYRLAHANDRAGMRRLLEPGASGASG
jgi:hypothetical protein